jgi:hypothetical protein
MIDVKFYKFLYNLNERDDVGDHWNKIGKDSDYYPNLEKFYTDFPNFDYKKYSNEEFDGIKKFISSDSNNLLYQNYFDKNFNSYIKNNNIEKIIINNNNIKNNSSIFIDSNEDNLTLKKIISELNVKYKIKQIDSINQLNECKIFINFKKKISKEFFTLCYNNNIIFISYDYEHNIIIKKTGYPYLFKTKNQLFKLLEVIYSNKYFDIVVPCYNCEEYIINTLKSIMSQTYKNFNVYLINDNSKDDTLKIISKYASNSSSNSSNITIINNEINYGKYISINKILPKLNGDYMLIVDSDDLIVKNRLLNDLIEFHLYPNILITQSKYYRYDEETLQIVQKPSYGENIITMDKKIFNIIGYFFPTKFGGDTEFIERILKFLGDKYIKQYNRITYISIIKKDKTNLTKKISLEKRHEFIRKYRELHENNNVEFFLKLFK